MKKKVDEMVLEDFKTLANDYKVYSALGSDKKMTLRKYRAALRDFNEKYPGRILYFEKMRGEMKRKLAEEAYEQKGNGTITAEN
ncbi:unnamed protein product [Cylicostephanus goldi]|uniref:Uncharacterized protein n=1 Tax=Cylicostephanus goldi TaxID=71465 RepID=A0A3P6SDK8_CYLGO|nr:unnamed protein product [Cylicostephanus goldi]